MRNIGQVRPPPVHDILIDLADDSPEPQAFYRIAYSFSKCELDTTGIEDFLGGDRVGAVEVDCVRTQLKKDLERCAACPCNMPAFTLGVVMLFNLSFFTVLAFTAKVAWIVIMAIVVGGTFFCLINYGFWKQIKAYHQMRESKLKESLKTCNRFYLGRRGAGVYIQKGYEGLDRQIIVLVIFRLDALMPGNQQELQLQISQEERLRREGLVAGVPLDSTSVVTHIAAPPPLVEIDFEKQKIKPEKSESSQRKVQN